MRDRPEEKTHVKYYDSPSSCYGCGNMESCVAKLRELASTLIEGESSISARGQETFLTEEEARRRGVLTELAAYTTFVTAKGILERDCLKGGGGEYDFKDGERITICGAGDIPEANA